MKQMAALFKRGDKETADRVREGVKLIVNMALMGRASEVYAHLNRLHDGKALDPNDSAFDLRQHANVDGIDIDVEPVWNPGKGGNRVLAFHLSIRCQQWILAATMFLESANENSRWLALTYPSGSCTNQQAALQGLTDLAAQQIVFSAMTG